MANHEKIEFDFKEISNYKVEVKHLDHKSDTEISSLPLKVKDCLTNSYLIAERKSGAEIVEGILVTFHDNGDIQCVGHAWNLIGGKHIDYTFLLKTWEGIEDIEYYAFRTYPSSEKNVDIREIQDYNRLKRR